MNSKSTDAAGAYARAFIRVRRIYEDAAAGRPIESRWLKRAVLSLAEAAVADEARLLRLTALRGYGDELPRHYTNVCVLSLSLGKRVGLSGRRLLRLGMAALLHDIGRSGMPDDLFIGNSEPDDDALEDLNTHPVKGFDLLLKLGGLDKDTVPAILVTYEHHMNLDGTGYPPRDKARQPDIFSRIVRIADNYDSSTSTGVYGRLALRPDKALELMRKRAVSYYDPDILSVFALMMGAYPVGSLLLLSDQTVGVVCEAGGEGDGYARPVVRLVAKVPSHAGEPEGAEDGEEGLPIGGGPPVDLAEKDAAGGYAREIAGSLDPSLCRLNVNAALLQPHTFTRQGALR